MTCKNILLRALLATAITLAAIAPVFSADKDKTLVELMNDPVLKGAVTGYVIRDLDNGKVLFSVNEDKVMLPASNMKIITGAAALLALGPRYRFYTDYFTKHYDREKGISNGLYVRGYGDPTLKEEFYETAGAGVERHVAELWAAGLRKVQGVLWLDDSFFAGVGRPKSWEDEDLEWCYASRPGALSVGDNCLRVIVRGGARGGAKPEIEIDPPPDPAMMTVNVKTVSKGASAVKIEQSEAGWITISGRVRAKKELDLEYVVPSPALLYGSVLLGSMKRAGISVSSDMRLRSGIPAGYTVYRRVTSEELASVLAEMGKESDNFVAEQVVLLLGALKSWGGVHESGTAVMENIMKKYELADDDILSITDGSGLSRKNRLTPRVLIAVLSAFYNSYLKEEMVGMLAEPGKEGTLKKRAPDAGGRLWAKTGALRGVCALSGYYRRSNGNMAAFVILMNGYSVHSNHIRALQDKMIERMLKL